MKTSRENLSRVSELVTCEERSRKLTPGSDTDAWTNDDMQTKEKYANVMGRAGETLCHSHGAEKARKSTHSNRMKTPVAMLMGFPLVFCHLPPSQNLVFPSKYW